MLVPRLMCTQHPDATVKISVQQEVDEAIQGYTMYGCEEVMSDYEGKLTPYAQPKDIVMRAHELELPIGEKFYVTPRIPNPSLEDFDRVDLSIEAGIIANYYSQRLAGVQAVKWFILPMVEDAETIRLIQRLIIRKLRVIREELRVAIEPVQLIPLLEDVHRHVTIQDYIAALLKVLKEFNVEIEQLRVFLGKSDAAVKSGHLASALSVLYAISELYKLANIEGVEVKPIIGMGIPPFRGALNNPELVDKAVVRYSGFSTATIQSAVRYDVPFKEYIKVKEQILLNVNKPPRHIPAEVIDMVNKATKMYRELASRYVDVVQRISLVVPSTRERISWKVYGRILPTQRDALSVPRAIVYTSAWYATGLPPTFLDADMILHLHKHDQLDEVLRLLPHLVDEWRYDSRFYVREVVLNRLDEYVVKKVDEALEVLGVDPEPLEPYRSLIRLNPIEPHIQALGKLRGFLG
ncbi:MAG: phosphoenolpyruvate carboxylase [Desulfurococcaceae archaeon]